MLMRTRRFWNDEDTLGDLCLQCEPVNVLAVRFEYYPDATPDGIDHVSGYVVEVDVIDVYAGQRVIDTEGEIGTVLGWFRADNSVLVAVKLDETTSGRWLAEYDWCELSPCDSGVNPR